MIFGALHNSWKFLEWMTSCSLQALPYMGMFFEVPVNVDAVCSLIALCFVA